MTVPKLIKCWDELCLLCSKAVSFQKQLFPQIPLGYCASPRHKWFTHILISSWCPCMEAKCAEIPKCLWVPAVLGCFYVVWPWGKREEWNAGNHLWGFSSLKAEYLHRYVRPLLRAVQRSPWIQRKFKSIRIYIDKLYKKEVLVTFFSFYHQNMPFSLKLCSLCSLPWFASTSSDFSGAECCKTFFPCDLLYWRKLITFWLSEEQAFWKAIASLWCSLKGWGNVKEGRSRWGSSYKNITVVIKKA